MTSDPEDICGISKWWGLPNSPFSSDCAAHDIEHLKQEAGTQTKSRKQVDREFLANMLKTAGNSRTLKLRAYLFYGVVRTFGWIYW